MTSLPPPPPTLDSYRNGTKLRAGLGEAVIIADLDFETYSPAGYQRGADGRLHPPRGCSDSGLFAVGAACYSEHPDAEVICMAYDLKDGRGRLLWRPTIEWRPTDLFEYLAAGGLLEAWNVSFEYWIWSNICVPKYGFPPLPIKQLRCAAAKARAHALPGGLEKTGEVLDIQNKKDKDGKRLIGKFSIPRHFTKDDKRERILPHEDQHDADLFYKYCLRDIQAEAELSSLIPDLTPEELEFWQCDQAINRRGIQIDLDHVNAAINIIEQAYAKYNARLRELTNGEVSAASEVARLIRWLATQEVYADQLDAKTIETLLSNPTLSPTVREVLKIRQGLSSAAVKKLYSMANRANKSGRVNDLFIYHSARTGRAAGEALQPQNLPKSGPDVWHCDCGRYYSLRDDCPWCGFLIASGSNAKEWNHGAVLDALETIRPGDLNCMEYYWDDPLGVIAGCLRSLIIAAPGYDLICSDYSAIEAVVLAALAGEEWRMDVFRTHGQIYEMSAAKITGIAFEEFERHRRETGSHHPARGKVGKVAELASGYGGYLGAWKQFGADKFMSDDEIKQAALAWRRASPKIVQMWGGQGRYGSPPYGLEGAAIASVASPGKWFEYNGIGYITQQNILYCRLLSGRLITYHRPLLQPGERSPISLSFEGWNTNPKNGPIHKWIRMRTYGGKLTENVVQATARDILAHAVVNLERAGYPVVLHVHDEIVAEVPKNYGSVEEFERIMSTLPEWARDWPVRARGGWRGDRYRKEG
jgi:DNA polymerase